MRCDHELLAGMVLLHPGQHVYGLTVTFHVQAQVTEQQEPSHQAPLQKAHSPKDWVDMYHSSHNADLDSESQDISEQSDSLVSSPHGVAPVSPTEPASTGSGARATYSAAAGRSESRVAAATTAREQAMCDSAARQEAKRAAAAVSEAEKAAAAAILAINAGAAAKPKRVHFRPSTKHKAKAAQQGCDPNHPTVTAPMLQTESASASAQQQTASMSSQTDDRGHSTGGQNPSDSISSALGFTQQLAHRPASMAASSLAMSGTGSAQKAPARPPRTSVGRRQASNSLSLPSPNPEQVTHRATIHHSDIRTSPQQAPAAKQRKLAAAASADGKSVVNATASGSGGIDKAIQPSSANGQPQLVARTSTSSAGNSKQSQQQRNPTAQVVVSTSELPAQGPAIDQTITDLADAAAEIGSFLDELSD